MASAGPAATAAVAAGAGAAVDTRPMLSATNPHAWFGPADLPPPTAASSKAGVVRPPLRKLLIVAIHGNEPCGVTGFNALLTDGFFATHFPAPTAGSEQRPLQRLEVVLGNPTAFSAGKRFIHKNLNRLIDPKHYVTPTADAKGDEWERARVIGDAIARADLVLDLHSCSADAPPHALPAATPASLALASALPVYAVVTDIAHATADGGTTMDAVKRADTLARQQQQQQAAGGGATAMIGVGGASVECGQHAHPHSALHARALIEAFVRYRPSDVPPTATGGDVMNASAALVVGKSTPISAVPTPAAALPAAAGVADAKQDTATAAFVPLTAPPLRLRTPPPPDGAVLVRTGFRFVRDVRAFEHVRAGELVAHDDVGGELRCPLAYTDGAHLVMPTRLPFVGEEAWFWGLPVAAPAAAPARVQAASPTPAIAGAAASTSV